MRPRRSFSSSASVAAVIATLGRTRVWTAPSIDGGKGPVWHDMDPDISDRVFRSTLSRSNAAGPNPTTIPPRGSPNIGNASWTASTTGLLFR